MNILYIGHMTTHAKSGADQINKRNIHLLEEIQGKTIDYVEPCQNGISSKIHLQITNEVLKKIKDKIIKNNYSHVFISQSLYGRATKFIKKEFPSIKIITFFHNIEIQYAKEYKKVTGFKAFPFYLTVKYYEKLSIKYTDKYITLNDRDNNLLGKIYGKKANAFLPTSFEDNFNYEKMISSIKEKEYIDYLFVGVAFFANIEAVNWFIDNVLPYIDGTFTIVGKGMNNANIHKHERVRIYGYVENISEFYYRAKLIISPVFSGGGMKTKTAEALMYGKMIIGTTEAFEGYEIDTRCMRICNTKEDYIREINNTISINYYNEYARNLFLEKYEVSKQIKTISLLFN